MFAYLGLKQERRWKIYLSAIFLGLSMNVRVQSFFFAPLLLAMALFPSEGRAPSLVSPLLCSYDRLCAGGQPDPRA